jgi:hypothetical protein
LDVDRVGLYRKLYGAAPHKDASPAEKLRYVRRIAISGLLFYLPLLVVVVGFAGAGWLLAVLGGCLLLSLGNLAWLGAKIHRAERSASEL